MYIVHILYYTLVMYITYNGYSITKLLSSVINYNMSVLLTAKSNHHNKIILIIMSFLAVYYTIYYFV